MIVPVYRVEPYLNRCVDSILNQSYQNFELILVDDGSPDKCGAICDEYAQKDSRIHVIHQKNGGLSAARNAGIDWVFAHSDSQWLAFIDSDDWVHRDYLKILLENALACNAEVSACDLLQTGGFCRDHALEGKQVISLRPEQAYCAYYGFLVSACIKLFRKSLFVELRFPVGKIHEDCYVTQIPLFSSENVAISLEKLYYYYYNSASITRTKWSEDRRQELEAHMVRLNWLKDNGYLAAAKREQEECVWMLATQLQAVRELDHHDPLYKKYEKRIFGELRQGLSQGRKEGLLPLNSRNCWIYELVYPVKPFWLVYNLVMRIAPLRRRKDSGEVKR